MRRLTQHMSYANIAATAALVFAMTGGAYAVSNGNGNGNGGSNGPTSHPAAHLAKKPPPKGKPGPRGPAGPRGATGAAGPGGSAGPAGAAGPKGDNGASGANGTNGANGEGVSIGAASAGECPEGGTKFTNATGTGKACNGEEGLAGKNGAAGEPWTPDSVLPPKATETGTWAFGPMKIDPSVGYAILPVASFPIQLKEPLESAPECGTTGHPACRAQIVGELPSKSDTKTPQCTGTFEHPEAEPGYFCLYLKEQYVVTTEIVELIEWNVGRNGVMAFVRERENIPQGEEPYVEANGTWAVTAE